ncbi:MAG: hypothetical protein OEM39_00875 [Acidimicrobiia bacterium]|nr:hypothetical protein [Acidimicrobiia bacterium]
MPNPRFKAGVDSDRLSGWEWAPNSTVNVTVDGLPIAFGTDEWGNFDGEAGVDLDVGQYLTATDGPSSKDFFVRNLTVDDVDADDELVHGTSTPGDVIQVDAYSETGAWREAIADSVTGEWTADFSVPWQGQPAFDIAPGTSGNARYYEADGDETERSWHLSNPYITASVIHEEVWATDFPNEPAGLTLYYRLDDPTTSGIDFEGDMPLLVNSWGTEAGDRSFGRYDVQAGQIFTVRNRPFGQPLDGGIERDLYISYVTVTGVDDVDDLITGTADPAEGPYLCVWSNDAQLCSDQAGFTWNPDFTWEADFSSIGSDVAPGHWNSVSQFEADGDETHFWWNLPPWIVVELAEEDTAGTPLWPDAVRAEQWTGPVVYLEIDGNPIAEWIHEGSGDYTFELPSFDIEPGHLVRMYDSADEKTVLVEPLHIDQVNYAGALPPATPNTVEGTAAPNRDVRVEASATVGGWWAERWVNADASGDFTANFGVPGNGWREQWTADLGGAEGLGRHMRLEIYDSDNDRVETRQCEGLARIEVARSDGRVDAYDFPEGATVTLDIVDPAGGDGYTGTAISVRNPENPCETIATFDLGDYVVPDEATVSADDGAGTTATTVVVDFTIDEVNADLDTVSGEAPIGAEVFVEADGNWRYVVAEDDPDDGLDVGYWLANFSVAGPDPGEEFAVDIGPGSSGRAVLLDDVGNTTELSWYISNAQFNVDPAYENISGNEFAPGTVLTITVDHGDVAGAVAVPGGPYSTDGSGSFNVGFDQAELDLVAGDAVVVTDGTTTKAHTVTGLAITGVDPVADKVFGVAALNSSVDVWVHGSNAWRRVVADTDVGDGLGSWMADFTAAGIDEPDEQGTADLEPGSNGNSGQCDLENDCTNASWWVLNPTFTVETPYSVWSSNQDWELGDTITLTINDPSFVPMTTTVVPNEGDPDNFGWSFDLEGVFPILLGSVVTVTDGETPKSLTVVDLTIAAISSEDDTVAGWLLDEAGEPLADMPVEVDVDNENGYSHRTAFTGPDGYWIADFSVAGEGEGEEAGVFAIGANTGVSAQVFDEDGDSIHRGDCFECDGGGYQIDPIWIEHGDVLISETDGTLWLYRPDTGELFEYPLPFGGVWDIQWIFEDTLFIANSTDGLLWALHLPSGGLEPIEDDLFGFPIGMSIQSSSAIGWSPSAAWIADGDSGILRLDDSGVTQIVDIEGADGIVVAADGTVYFDLGGTLYVVDESAPGNHRAVAHVDGYGFNGLVMTPQGKVLATSMGSPALVTIDPADGSYTVEDYPQLWTPEDSAFGRTGEIYVIDSGYENNFGDQSGLYVRNDDGTLTQLISHDDYPEFGDTVDLLVVGPSVTVTKEASHTEVFAPGELVTFDITVYNQLGPFGPVSVDSLHDSMAGDLTDLEGCQLESLASGESFTCSYSSFVGSDVTNTVAAGWTDQWGFSAESTDSASVLMVDAQYVTDSSLCSFGGQFDLVFTPDMKNWPGHYKLAASNPGQFYWNGFFVAGEDVDSVVLEVPYPFVTQGAMPLHVYEGALVDGAGCFIPMGEIGTYDATFGLGDYTDTDGDGGIGFGDVLYVEVPAVAGFQYATLHLDYGLEKTNGWVRAGEDAYIDPAVNPDPGVSGLTLVSLGEYRFALQVDESPVAHVIVTNVNEFKNVKGFGGLVLFDGTEAPVEGAVVELHKGNGQLIETMATDEQGWYLSDFTHKGKSADYSLVLLGSNDSVDLTVGKAVKFGEGNFFVSQPL